MRNVHEHFKVYFLSFRLYEELYINCIFFSYKMMGYIKIYYVQSFKKFGWYFFHNQPPYFGVSLLYIIYALNNTIFTKLTILKLLLSCK